MELILSIFINFSKINISIYGFEPFIEAFEISPNRPALIKKGIEIYPWALWEESKNLSFNKGEFSSSTSSVINTDSMSDIVDFTTVKGVKIDSFVEEKGIDSICLLKLDIEGAEMEALKGARETIKKYRPQLAISIYHKKEHLFEIPEYLKELYPDYTFKIGFYSSTFVDAILYALP